MEAVWIDTVTALILCTAKRLRHLRRPTDPTGTTKPVNIITTYRRPGNSSSSSSRETEAGWIWPSIEISADQRLNCTKSRPILDRPDNSDIRSTWSTTPGRIFAFHSLSKPPSYQSSDTPILQEKSLYL